MAGGVIIFVTIVYMVIGCIASVVIGDHVHKSSYLADKEANKR